MKKKHAESGYREKIRRTKTWSGIDLKEVYTPKDSKPAGYKNKIGNPGDFPYTRGIHQNMYRGKLWTRRQPWGFGTSEDTNKQMKYLIEHGNTGLMVFRDQPTMHGLDSDHPLAKGEVGVSGVPLVSIEDMEDLFEGIPLEDVSVTLLCASVVSPVILAQYLGVAKRRGLDISKLRGTISNDPIMSHVCYSDVANPPDLGVKIWGDLVEYCYETMPVWHAAYVSSCYNMREYGLDAPQEIAFGLMIAALFIETCLERGMKIDNVAARMSFYCSAGIDIFEEVAKFRAMRRMWAFMIRDKYSAKKPASMQFKFAVQCAGHSLIPQQPLNNIARTSFETLAAVLSGAQSVFTTTFVEPVCLPTEDAQRNALSIQGIVAHETGAATVVDPLGGSYYVEHLTDEIEDKAAGIMKKIEKMGGFIKALKTGWVQQMIDEGNQRYHQEIEDGERLIVGQNYMAIPPEEDTLLPGGLLEIPPDAEHRQVARVNRMKANRDHKKLEATIKKLREGVIIGDNHNFMPYIIEAVEAKATVEEIMGTIRTSRGLTWDPWGYRQSPFSGDL
ncbi:methylmalonyl-CoA mutase, N-terminal domain [Desulfosarcina sp. BuS5]|uniref:methylmalonyl-CoA mutase family protein n=1 Tax=Desulfosarcina sp. BuS5 TaxID=933262 RepID=UPI0006881900|nr:methylmalonyl-CoA mutase family protein [Desulfosarcina sp. BuS5]WDN89147.1 methylmalonyl-CoA mutase, N-terminal domain [Desulfosarcina sp. BuS5]